MKTLLEKVGILNLRYEKLKNKNDFNVFTILRNRNDEVKLHSRFIYELLNPKGTHRQSNIFLIDFLETAGIKEFGIENVSVFRERRQIDILITNSRQAIIIENKIWAGDQNNQLERYYDKINEQGFEEIWIVYLTLDESMPTDNSLGRLPESLIQEYLITLSYSYHISEWLEKCIERSSRHPTLRETIIQYNQLVQEMTGNSMSKDQREEVIELLSKQDNIHNAFTIASNWIHIRWHVEWNFWNDLENIVSVDYEILPIQKYSRETLNSVINKSRNRNPWYGIMFELFPIGEDKICLFIERGIGDLYYGITVVNSGKRSPEKHNEYSNFAKKLNKFTDLKKRHLWLGINHLKPRINFELFASKETLNLIKKENRDQYLNKNWLEIKEFIEKVKLIKAAPNKG